MRCPMVILIGALRLFCGSQRLSCGFQKLSCGAHGYLAVPNGYPRLTWVGARDACVSKKKQNLLVQNSQSIIMLLLNIKQAFLWLITEVWYYRMELTEVNKLNLPSTPCNDDPSYHFQSCLRKSISAKASH